MPARNRPSVKLGPTAEAAADRPPETHHHAPELRLLGEMRSLTSREERIAMAAYWRAANRQFEPGHELADWLAAEAEIDSIDRATPHADRE